ncbi:MAG: hypothetical protein WCY77_09900 [Weeksellaceae bacterium]
MKKKIIKKTTFLLPNNGFCIGLGSVLNLAGNYFEYNYSNSANDADRKAIESDWENIGEDIKIAKMNLEKELEDDLCLIP